MSLIFPQSIEDTVKQSFQQIPASGKEEMPTSLISFEPKNLQVSHLVHCLLIRFHGEILLIILFLIV